MKTKIVKIMFMCLFIFAIFSVTKHVKADTFTEEVGTLTWEYEVSDGKAINARIKRDENTKIPVILNIPSSLGGYDVVSIGNGTRNILDANMVFEGSESTLVGETIVFKVVLPDTVTTINDRAFSGLPYMYDIDFGNSVETIGNYAFLSCLNLRASKELVIPDTVTTIGDYAFSLDHNADNNVINPMGGGIHRWWSRYTACKSVKIGSGVKTIGSNAFSYNGCLQSIEIPANVTTIKSYAFANTGIHSLELPNVNVEIGDYAFYNCNNLDAVTIPANILKIGQYAFSACDDLTSITFEDRTSNVSLGAYVFSSCNSLENVTVRKMLTLSTGTFAECLNLKTVTFEDGVTTTGYSTFYNCSALVDVTKTSSVTTIGYRSFYGCKSLTTEEYNDIVKNISIIENEAFKECIGLTGKIVILPIVTNLGSGTFEKCSNIESVEVQAPINAIPYYCFENCIKLKNIQYSDNIIYVKSSAFKGCISIEKEALEKEFLNHIVEIGTSAFAYNTGIEGVFNIPESVKTIGNNAFYECKNIEDVVYNSISTSIGSKAFYIENKEFETIRINSPLRTIGGYFVYASKDIYISNEEKNVSKGHMFYGLKESFVHYSDCKHEIKVTCTLPGVTLTNVTTPQESELYECESTQKFKLNIESGYSYPELEIILKSEGDYKNSEIIEEKIVLDANNEFTISNLIRNKEIIVRRVSNGTDLVLRQYIESVNGTELYESREPNIEVLNSGILGFNYNHTKQPVVVNEGDVVVHTVRIYNEGKQAGSAKKVSVRLGEGLEFVKSNETNKLYGWVSSDDGKTITTEYIKEKEIPAYNSGRPEYEELQFVCQVQKQTIPNQYMVALAEITDGNDFDSCPNSTSDIDLNNYMKDKIETSNKYTYFKGVEDDTDIETLILSAGVQIGYDLIVKKTDINSNELLNGSRIKLYNENKEEIANSTCTNGVVNFGNFSSFGEGEDVYYIEETELPIGYKRTLDGLLELKVVKEIEDSGEIKVEIICDMKEIEVEEEEFKPSTVDSYIPITTAEQLKKIGSGEQVAVNGKIYEFKENANYQLQNNIDLSSIGDWKPINKMVGVFDGNNFTISNMKITDASATYPEVGLFRNASGAILNLTLNGVNINLTSLDDTNTLDSNGTQIGALVGYFEEGYIINCNVNGSAIIYDGKNIGGLVGHTKGTVQIENSISNIETISGSYNIGGLIGCAKGKTIIENSTNNSKVIGSLYNVGGLVGNANSDLYITKCNNNGEISNYEGMAANNIGGLVGYINEGHYFLVKEGINTGVISGNDNIGGIVGFSESYANITTSENKGNVTGTGYNVGGLIGMSFAKNCKPSNLDILYDESNKSIVLYLKNREAVGSYDLKIVKVDLGNNIALAGAKFNVYNTNKELIQSNAEVNDKGELLLNNIEINSVGTDRYYIKEVEAPKGYEILARDYVEVIVNKTWNSAEEKYEISTKVQLAEEMIEKENVSKTAKTGKIETPENYASVLYAINGANIEKSKNSGNITGAASVAGLLGGSRSNVYVDNSSNSGEIIGVAIGGIAGDLKQFDENLKVNITNCNNTGKIIGRCEGKDIRQYGDSAGGILGVTLNELYIYNCINDGEVISEVSSLQYGGIVGKSLKNSKIYNCVNNANIYYKDFESNMYSNREGTAGGIVGNSVGEYYSYNYDKINDNTNVNIECDYLELVDCENYGDINGIHSAGGIVGRDEAYQTIILNCKNENNNIICSLYNYERNAGGIVGQVVTEYLTLENCNVRNSNITGGKSAGLIGQKTFHKFMYDSAGNMFSNHPIKIFNLSVLNCKVEECIMNGNESSGVINIPYGYTQEMQTINIKNFELSGTENNKAKLIAKDSAGGILSTTYGGSAEYIDIDIDNCIINNVDIENAIQSGGLIGFIYPSSYNGINLDITNNNISNLSISGYEGGYYSTSAAGLLGGMFSTGEMNALIENCNIENICIDGKYGNTGGIIGHWYKGDLDVKNTNVNGFKCTMDNYGESINVGGAFGGIYGAAVKLDNINVSDFDINANATNVGGLMGYSYISESYNGISFNNISVIGKKTDGSNSTISGIAKNMGGFSGFNYGSGIQKNVNFNNCSVSNVDIESESRVNYENNVGGFTGALLYVGDCKDIDINDVNINVKANAENKVQQVNAAGFVATMNSGSYNVNSEVENVNVKNLNIESYNAGNIAGAIGNTMSIFAKKITVDNCTIKVPDEKVLRNSNTECNNVAGIVAVAGNEVVLDEIEAKNVNISIYEKSDVEKADKLHIGGICAVYFGVMDNSKINNAIVENMVVNNPSESGIIGGICGVIAEDYLLPMENNIVKNVNFTGNYAVGGILGCGGTLMNNCEVHNSIFTAKTGDAAVGSAVGISCENSELSNITVTADTDTEKTYGVFSDFVAGGIIGINSSKSLKDSTVDNITVKTTYKGGGAGIQAPDSSVEGSENIDMSDSVEVNLGNFTYISEIVGQYINNAINCVFNNVTVIK